MSLVGKGLTPSIKPSIYISLWLISRLTIWVLVCTGLMQFDAVFLELYIQYTFVWVHLATTHINSTERGFEAHAVYTKSTAGIDCLPPVMQGEASTSIATASTRTPFIHLMNQYTLQGDNTRQLINLTPGYVRPTWVHWQSKQQTGTGACERAVHTSIGTLNLNR